MRDKECNYGAMNIDNLYENFIFKKIVEYLNSSAITSSQSVIYV